MARSFPALSKVAKELVSMHTTACAAERNWSQWGLLYPKNRSRLACERATKLSSLKQVLALPEEVEAELMDLS